MQTYVVNLKSEPSKTFLAQKAADSLDIDVNKKLEHNLTIKADIQTEYSVGLIIGASGSGKTTLAKHIFGNDCFKNYIDIEKPIIDQFPKEYTYDQCAEILNSVGLTQVVCWIRPVKTLSNGQKTRAEFALSLVYSEFNVIDEWTSVVDRTVAKVMSHCIQKHTRKNNKKVVLLSCHYDVIEWLNPDWIIDCNKQEFIDRRLLSSEQRTRTEKLKFDIKEIDRNTWKYFSKYHYLSEKLPGGKIYTFGLFHENNQIGFQCFAAYTIGNNNMFHSNRTVVHPDYAGFGLGIKLINESSKYMSEKGFDVRAKFSSVPIFKAMSKDNCWNLLEIKRETRSQDEIFKDSIKKGKNRTGGARTKVKTFTFKYIGNK